MNPEQYGVGVVGSGIMGRRMLAALQAHPRFRVDALFDPSPVSIAQAQGLVREAVAVDSLSALVARPGLQLVYVASPPAAHGDAVQASLAAGRAVLCEKPLAADLPQALALQQAVAAAGLPFAVNFPFARAAACLQLAQALQAGPAGPVGAPHTARITLRFAQWPRPWQAGASAWLAGAAEGGFTREVLSHFVFLAQRLFGPAQVTDVRLTRAPNQTETALQATLVHAGLQVQVDAAVAGDVADHNRFEVSGPQGSLALVDWSRLEREGQPLAPRTDSTPSTLDAVALQLAGVTDHGLATVEEAVAVVRTIEALLA
jgi:predicted dehydrogenase